jgi:hypothetical protein
MTNTIQLKADAIPESAFSEIIKELERQPLAINEYRLKSGSGRSQAFGIVNRRNLPPDYSRNCWCRPYLYHLLLEFGKQYVDLSFNAITVNQNYKAEPHKDKNNVGDSYLVAFGDYSGGELDILEGERQGSYNINRTPIKDDFSKVLHSVKDFTGNRYSLVYYNFCNKRLPTDLPLGTVKKEGSKYFFYRGDKKVTRKEGLPHNLKGKKKDKIVGIIKEMKEVVISFD